MAQVDLTALSVPELRRLLGASRERGQAAVSYQILQELAARRERGLPRLFVARRPAEPRVVAVDLGDPIAESAPDEETEDDIPPLPPGWVPQAPAPAAATARSSGRSRTPPSAGTPRKTVVAKVAPAPTAGVRATSAAQATPALEPPPDPVAPRPFEADRAPGREPLGPPRERSPRRELARWSGLIFAGGVAMGATFGWWAEGVTQRLFQQDTAVTAAASTPAPAGTPVTAAPPTATPAAAAPVQDASGDVLAADLPSATAPPVVRPAAPPLGRLPRAAPAGCVAAATPADRTICRHPQLVSRQRELRRAYAEALVAHADRARLRQRQLAWREARNAVTAPDRLAQLYDERIRRLHAATADAKRQRQHATRRA